MFDALPKDVFVALDGEDLHEKGGPSLKKLLLLEATSIADVESFLEAYQTKHAQILHSVNQFPSHHCHRQQSMNSAWILIKSDFSRTVTATPDDQLLFFATNNTLDSFFPCKTFLLWVVQMTKKCHCDSQHMVIHGVDLSTVNSLFGNLLMMLMAVFFALLTAWSLDGGDCFNFSFWVNDDANGLLVFWWIVVWQRLLNKKQW